MLFRQLFDAESSTYTYLVADAKAGVAALVDPVREHLARDLQLLQELGLKLRWIFETHIHADHVTSASELRTQTGAQTACGPRGAICADVHARHGQVLELGALSVQVLETPGHTDDSVSFLVQDRVFTGDALMVRTVGRTDFQNGNPRTLYRSVTQVLFALPDDVLVFPAHDYKGQTVSTIGEEKRFNTRVAGRSEEDFVTLMNGLKLPPPKKLVEAVSANQSCGRTALESHSA
jgi:sulfur dioxygenase